MTNEANLGGMEIMSGIRIAPEPIKLVGMTEPTMSPQEVERQAEAAAGMLVDVPAEQYITCIDERPREGNLEGETTIEARGSVIGGIVYASYISVALGVHLNSPLSARERLIADQRTVNQAGVPSGGHLHCAANASFGPIVDYIAEDHPEVVRYAQANLGEDYDQSAMDEVVHNMKLVSEAKIYEDWNETILVDALGDEAGKAIEVLVDVPHKARTFIRNGRAGKTIDQTTLYEKTGEYSFVHDEAYAERIEHSLATGLNAAWMAVVARHTREAVLAAVVNALPNQELHQINLV
jgi:hypothetical protein